MPSNACRSDISRAVGQRIREMRLAQGKTLRQLSEAAGFLSFTQLSKLEVGDRRVSVDDLVPLAHALGCSATALLSSSNLWA